MIAYAVELMESLHEKSLWMQQLSKLKQEDWCQQPSWPQASQDIVAELSAGQGVEQTFAHRIRACFLEAALLAGEHLLAEEEQGASKAAAKKAKKGKQKIKKQLSKQKQVSCISDMDQQQLPDRLGNISDGRSTFNVGTHLHFTYGRCQL